MANGGIVGGLFPTVSRIPGFYGDVGPEGIPMTAGAYAALPGATVQPPDPSDLNMARAQQIAGRGMEQVNNVSNMRGLSDRQKAVAIGSVAGDVARKGVDIDVSSAADQLRGLSARQQLGLSQSQYGASSAFGRSQGRGRRNRFDDGAMLGEHPEGYKDGGIIDGLLAKMAEKYGIANPPPESMRPVEVKPQAAQQKKSEPPRRGFRTAERWREGGDYPIDVKYADGGRVIPVNIGQGLYQAIAQPIAEDWKQGNVAIKNVRDQYPIADTIAGIHPAVAAAQVANDVMSGQVSGDTAMNVAQAVPMVKGLSGMAKLSSKQSGPTVGGTKFVVDMPGTVKKNMALTAGQAIGYPANAFADGGMIKFSGKGGPREDKIPVKVAGSEIKVSDEEAAVILPAKTAANPAALGIIGALIEHTNDGRKPKMGMRDGGKYARGAIPDDEELRRTGSPIGSPLTIFGGSRPITEQEMYNYGPKASVTVPPGTVGGDLTASGRHGDAVEGGSITNLAPALRAIKTTGASIGNVFSDSAAAQRQGTTYDAVRSARIAKEAEAAASAAQSKQPATIGNEGRGAGISAAVNPIAVQRDVTQPQPSGSRAIDGGMTVSQMGAGFDPTKLQMAPGYGMASNAAGKTIGGNMSPNQYVSADGTPGARWDETQQYKDAIARNERMKLELAAIQAGKKRGADPMAIQTAQQGIAGAMIGNQAKQEEMQRNDQSNALLKTAMNTKDPAQHRTALQNYLASRGVAMKDPDDWEIMAGGERSVPNGLGGFQVVKDPPIAFHKPTRQWIKADGSIGQSDGASQPKQAPQAAIEYLRANPGTAEQFKQRYGYLPQ